MVLRSGRKLGTTKKTSFTDRGAAPGKTYTYTVQALDRKGPPGKPTAGKRIKVPTGTTTLPTQKPPTG